MSRQFQRAKRTLLIRSAPWDSGNGQLTNSCPFKGITLACKVTKTQPNHYYHYYKCLDICSIRLESMMNRPCGLHHPKQSHAQASKPREKVSISEASATASQWSWHRTAKSSTFDEKWWVDTSWVTVWWVECAKSFGFNSFGSLLMSWVCWRPISLDSKKNEAAHAAMLGYNTGRWYWKEANQETADKNGKSWGEQEKQEFNRSPFGSTKAKKYSVQCIQQLPMVHSLQAAMVLSWKAMEPRWEHDGTAIGISKEIWKKGRFLFQTLNLQPPKNRTKNFEPLPQNITANRKSWHAAGAPAIEIKWKEKQNVKKRKTGRDENQWIETKGKGERRLKGKWKGN